MDYSLYYAAIKADDAYTAEVVRVYGARLAGTARC